MGSIGAGVKQRTNITSAKSARMSRVRSSGTSSSNTRGWRGPNMNSITIIRPVHTIQLLEKNASTTATPTVASVTYVERRPSTA